MAQASMAPMLGDAKANLGSTGDTTTDVKARSANILADPKMTELKHYVRSHLHEERMRESAELEQRPPSSAGARGGLRAQGCESMDTRMKSLSKLEATIPYVAKSS